MPFTLYSYDSAEDLLLAQYDTLDEAKSAARDCYASSYIVVEPTEAKTADPPFYFPKKHCLGKGMQIALDEYIQWRFGNTELKAVSYHRCCFYAWALETLDNYTGSIGGYTLNTICKVVFDLIKDCSDLKHLRFWTPAEMESVCEKGRTLLTTILASAVEKKAEELP